MSAPVAWCAKCLTQFPGGDGCCCTLYLSSQSPPDPVYPELPEGEVPPFWVSSAFDAHNTNQWCAGYGSKHDMDRFMFVDSTGEELKMAEILEKFPWVQLDVEMDLCDSCIDEMLEHGQLRRWRDSGDDDDDTVIYTFGKHTHIPLPVAEIKIESRQGHLDLSKVLVPREMGRRLEGVVTVDDLPVERLVEVKRLSLCGRYFNDDEANSELRLFIDQMPNLKWLDLTGNELKDRLSWQWVIDHLCGERHLLVCVAENSFPLAWFPQLSSDELKRIAWIPIEDWINFRRQEKGQRLDFVFERTTSNPTTKYQLDKLTKDQRAAVVEAHEKFYELVDFSG